MTSTDPTAAFRLDDKVVLITGASSGLGARFARVASAAGAAVVVAARRAERLAELVDELDDAHAVEVDLTAPGGPEACVARSIELAGRIDVLVNNAGISQVAPALDFSTEDFRHEIEIDLVAPFALAREVARDAITNDRSASIINIGSILGEVGGGKLRVPGYAAAKGGLHNLTRELASQWGRKGVRVNAIAPGWFETEMNDAMFSDGGGQAYMESGAAMGRPGIEGELDGAMLYLASDASSFVTGHVLQVSGGWTAT
ncbi:MAG: SDR family oxidoreductase [Actinomycetota bacterium]|nr:short-chain dehydrogenase [Acidimicrobiaceae bacterium]MEC7673797.1 SDR family oxidoreductase [Actinomycetota bacterium]MEC7967289.1 SDR family oxidoreductase [Actinomycetota bacterium]MEC8068702.1 SDR family oxidoreductase [Actinomycetota bacterium]MEC8687165.1 SDR family oxidoreductase [Actinomycetota bacterium]